MGPESEYHKLTVSGYSGTAGQSLSPDSGGKFYVVGQDNGCTNGHKGPWWHKNCRWSNINGVYSTMKDNRQLSWYEWNSDHTPLKK